MPPKRKTKAAAPGKKKQKRPAKPSAPKKPPSEKEQERQASVSALMRLQELIKVSSLPSQAEYHRRKERDYYKKIDDIGFGYFQMGPTRRAIAQKHYDKAVQHGGAEWDTRAKIEKYDKYTKKK